MNRYGCRLQCLKGWESIAAGFKSEDRRRVDSWRLSQQKQVIDDAQGDVVTSECRRHRSV